jgi:SAM-dependent methyltransferase
MSKLKTEVQGSKPAQSMSVKRAQVAFHNFASLGEPEKALAKYSAENYRRGGLLRDYRACVEGCTPFLEIGANVGHTSYLVANEFGGEGYALDISADALRHGQALCEIWGFERRPTLVAGDALRLPFKDGSLRFVMTFQTLSQFLDIEPVLNEIHRVLAPGGVFFMAEEPVRRKLSLRLYRVPYESQMKPWERWLHRHGWLDFITRDVIGAAQEESFGIRQNHRAGLPGWRRMLEGYFPYVRTMTFPRTHGWANRQVERAVWKFNQEGAPEATASLLGATLTAFCRKEGVPPPDLDVRSAMACPDCTGSFDWRDDDHVVCIRCGYEAVREEGVFNLLPSRERSELYPKGRPDIIDFTRAGHEAGLVSGFEPVEGQYGNKYRWIQGSARVNLTPAAAEPQRLRIQGFAPLQWFEQGTPSVEIVVNGATVSRHRIDRQGLFVLEDKLPVSAGYAVELRSTPVWRDVPGVRDVCCTLSLIRLLPASETD